MLSVVLWEKSFPTAKLLPNFVKFLGLRRCTIVYHSLHPLSDVICHNHYRIIGMGFSFMPFLLSLVPVFPIAAVSAHTDPLVGEAAPYILTIGIVLAMAAIGTCFTVRHSIHLLCVVSIE